MKMREELYYCSDWEHQSYKEYDVCVSDPVEFNCLLQIHVIATKNGEVARRPMTGFEHDARRYVREYMTKCGQDERDESWDVRIWYYEPDGGRPKKNIPLRLAITFFRPHTTDKQALDVLKGQLLQALFETLDMPEPKAPEKPKHTLFF